MMMRAVKGRLTDYISIYIYIEGEKGKMEKKEKWRANFGKSDQRIPQVVQLDWDSFFFFISASPVMFPSALHRHPSLILS
jgi:hypothetical protein